METRSKMAAAEGRSKYVHKNVITYAGEPRPRITLRTRARILFSHLRGLGNREIARKVGHSEGAVRALLRRFKKSGLLGDKPRSGRPHKIPHKIIAKLDKELESGNVEDLDDAIRWLKKHHNITITRPTMKKTVRNVGYHEYIKMNKPFTSETTAKDRVSRASEWLRWKDERWKRVIFSDEKQFALNDMQKKEKVLLKFPAGNNPRRLRVRPWKSNVTVNLWAAISVDGIIAHTFYGKKLTADVYKKVLSKDLLPKAKKAFAKNTPWILQHDNAPQHTPGVVTEFLVNKDVDVLYWPAYSPDINLIENMWVEVNRGARERNPRNRAELISAIEAAIKALNEQEPRRKYFKRLYRSMRSRLQEIIKSGGLPTKH